MCGFLHFHPRKKLHHSWAIVVNSGCGLCDQFRGWPSRDFRHPEHLNSSERIGTSCLLMVKLCPPLPSATEIPLKKNIWNSILGVPEEKSPLQENKWLYHEYFKYYIMLMVHMGNYLLLELHNILIGSAKAPLGRKYLTSTHVGPCLCCHLCFTVHASLPHSF